MKKSELHEKMATILENTKKPMSEFLGECNVATLQGWALADLSLCNEPVKEEKINGLNVKSILR